VDVIRYGTYILQSLSAERSQPSPEKTGGVRQGARTAPAGMPNPGLREPSTTRPPRLHSEAAGAGRRRHKLEPTLVESPSTGRPGQPLPSDITPTAVRPEIFSASMTVGPYTGTAGR